MLHKHMARYDFREIASVCVSLELGPLQCLSVWAYVPSQVK